MWSAKSKYCPIVDHKVTYMFCEDCEEKICLEKIDKNKEEDENNKEKK